MNANAEQCQTCGDEDTLTVWGGTPLRGEIRVRGAKNFVSKAMVASLLAPGESVIQNVPDIRDVRVVSNLLRLHGAKTEVDKESGVVRIDASSISTPNIADIYTLAGSSRIPILFAGPLLQRLGRVSIPSLGGDQIGTRPVDFHISILKRLGAEITENEDGSIELKAPHGLKGAVIHLPYPSVGATEQALLTSVEAEGKTEISGAAIEPEIMDLVAVLQRMGAVIAVDVDRTITVDGVNSLQPFTACAQTDRIEVASWASAALATKGDIFIRGAQQSTMMTYLNVYRKIGGKFDIQEDGIRFWHPGGDLNPIALETDVHPGFMTDWQPPLVCALTQAKGLSIVHETVYENRFGFTRTLAKMGAVIQLYSECLGSLPCRFGHRGFVHSAVIFGPTPLHGADINIPDIRGGFSHVIGALVAEGRSCIHGISLIDRGYEDFGKKLKALGAKIS